MSIEKITISYSGTESELIQALTAQRDLLNAKCALQDIAQLVFRPARKHGYEDSNINKLLEDTDQGRELVSALESLFYHIINDNNVDLDT